METLIEPFKNAIQTTAGRRTRPKYRTFTPLEDKHLYGTIIQLKVIQCHILNTDAFYYCSVTKIYESPSTKKAYSRKEEASLRVHSYFSRVHVCMQFWQTARRWSPRTRRESRSKPGLGVAPGGAARSIFHQVVDHETR